LWIVALMAVLAMACAAPDSGPVGRSRDRAAAPPPAAAGPARPRIVFLGDSLTAGLGLNKDQAVPSLVQARLEREGYRYDVVDAGVSGDTAAGGLSRLDWSLEGDVRVLVIELGANDGLRGNPVDGLARNLGEIITRAKKRGIQVLLTGMEAPPNFGQAYTAEFRTVYADLAREHGVAFMPFFLEGVAGIPGLNNADGIHPNPEGARIIEQTMWRTLEGLLEKQGR
jgi:acyl-CoA thioesterase-1